MNSEFMAFTTDSAATVTLREWAERQGFPADTVQSGGPDLLLSLLESEPAPKIVVVDMDNLEHPIQTASRLVSVCGASSKIIALDSANDVSLFRSMIAAGVADYLLKPITPEILTQAIAALNKTAQGNAPKETKIVVTLGTRGGVGTSTIAVNLAWIAAHEMKRKCALLDLDLQFGTSALALDLEPGRGLRDVVSSPQRVDSLMLAGAMMAESDMLSVISAEEALDDLIHVDSAAISALIKELKPNYSTIVVDLPRHLLASQKRLLAVAHEVVLVTEMSLVGIRDTLRILTVLKSLGSAGRVTIVTTRTGPQRPAAVDEATFAKGTKAKIDFILPDDHKNLITTSNSGKTLPAVAANAPLTKALRQLATHLLGTPELAKKENKSFFASLFGSEPKAQNSDKEAKKA